MASNESTLADPADGDFEDWIELFNPGETAIDLSGWFLSDDPGDPFQFRIPPGVLLPAEGFLVLWADGEVEQNEPTAGSVHLNFRLAAAGESIVLSAPDGSLVDRVDFGEQSPDKSMGRLDREVVALAEPSPGAGNGEAARWPDVSFTSDGENLTFNVVTEPGFRYQMEFSRDLVVWETSGPTWTAEETSLTVVEPLRPERRFYRFRRIP
jgi:hypothetical protein